MEKKTRTLLRTLLPAALLLCGFLQAAAGQSLWDDKGVNADLKGDNVACRRGDLLTIIIKESQKIQDKQEVKLERENSLDSVLESFNIAPNAFNTLPDMAQTTSKDFDGKSNYDKQGNFEARITVTITDVQPNGNLVLEGRRTIFMDDEEKSIKITGIVRPFDIATDNTVPSEKVADARVSYDGEGTLSRNTEKGWLDTLLDYIWPF